MNDQSASRDAGPKAPISACIIVRDEAAMLPDCLASVAFCQELVVVDSGSTDATVQIARAAGAHIVEQSWLGFSAQRNVALDHAHAEWVLEIDADERVTPQLRTEIEAFVKDPPAGVRLAGLPLRELFLGRALGPSAKYPKYRHRLLRRGAYRHDEQRTVHEGFVPDGPVHPFEGDLLHLLASSWREALGDAWRYARLEAGQLQARRSAGAVLRGALLRPSIKFAYRLTVDGGWRDGLAGVAKIALDCGTDAVVWLRYAAGLRGEVLGSSGVAGDTHYGARKARLGAARVVGVASGEDACEEALRWLEQVASAGADVSLIADGDLSVTTEGIRVRRLQRFGPLAAIRALDAEEQLRPLDAVVAFGSRAGLVVGAAPAELRGALRAIDAATDPASVPWAERERLEAIDAGA